MSKTFPPAVMLLLCAMASPNLAAEDMQEAAAATRFDEVVSSPTRLRIFMQAMPKGGDLHNHLAGTPYAEDYLKWAAMAGFCISGKEPALVPPPCVDDLAVKGLEQRNPFAFDKLVDGLSTRGLKTDGGRNEVSGHTQFFSSFGKFGVIAANDVARSLMAARMLAEGDQVSYVELIHDPNALIRYRESVPDAPLDESGLSAFFEREHGRIDAVVEKAMEELERDEAAAKVGLRCGQPSQSAACTVTIRYLAWGLRDVSPSQAFSSLILSFAIADRDRRFAGVNIVGPEDWPIALRDYSLHMAMFRFLRGKYPNVRCAMHAGELAFGVVPPSELRDHIRKALDAGAERIGHGTAIAYEQDAPATLARMARERIPVEINLTSNDVILGVKEADHPLALYRRMNVPVVLSTDDEGILRTDLTNEYVRASREQGFRYLDLKAVARASLEYAFLPGSSLWKNGVAGVTVEQCAQALTTKSCEAYLAASQKARLQVDLERRLQKFERWVVASIF